MTRLVLTLAAALALVLAIDAQIPRLLEHPWLAGDDFTQEGASLAAPTRLRDLLSDARLQVERTRRRFEAVPDAKPDNELRVFLVGNSAALFTIDPDIVGSALGERFPERDVRVVPLMLPLIRTPDERRLLEAALTKQPDVVVMTPALKGLHPDDSFLSDELRRAFPSSDAAEAPRGAVRRLEAWLRDNLHLLRSSAELRGIAVRSARSILRSEADARALAAVQRGFADIAQAAARNDRRALFAAYEANDLMFLLRREHFQRRLPPDAPAFEALASAARSLDGRAIGVALFMPINPLFRAGVPLAGFEEYHLDGGYATRLAARAVAVYEAAGFAAFDRIDFLPSESFFDLVHVHGEAIERFSLETARLVGDAWSESTEGTPR